MFLPKLKEVAASRQIVDVFGGYNHNIRISDGEFYEMQNMTGDNYPVLCPRKPRDQYQSGIKPTGMIVKNALYYTEGEDFVTDGVIRIPMGLDKLPKQLISFGSYVLILPDKKYINTVNGYEDRGEIDAEYSSTGAVSFALSKLDGTVYENIAAEEPENPENMALWIDTSGETHVLKQWSQATGTWVTISTTYVKISATGIGTNFEKYDGVTISGLKGKQLHDNATGDLIEDISQLEALDGNAVVWDKGDDYIVVVGILDTSFTIKEPITVARKMPDMDYIIESENRLWGCKYGLNSNGEFVNEIYASKLGDFKNWNCFMGLSTDSYAATCGTDGRFTGAITFGGYPLFFKENYLHKVYGSYPANFQIQAAACRGVRRDSAKSLAIVGETLLYLSRSGVCAYDGSFPNEVSQALGSEHFSYGVAGAFGNKYYISMRDAEGATNLFVFDLAKGLWHREDDLDVRQFGMHEGKLYAMTTDSILILDGGTSNGLETVTWMVQTGEIGIDSPDAKYISRLTLRMTMDQGAQVQFFAQYDTEEGWESLGIVSSQKLQSFSIPIRPRRCEYMKLRIEGCGMVKIYSITKNIEGGREIR